LVAAGWVGGAAGALCGCAVMGSGDRAWWGAWTTQTTTLTAIILVLSVMLLAQTIGQSPLAQHPNLRRAGGDGMSAVEVAMDAGMGMGVGMAVALAEETAESTSPPPPVAQPSIEESGACAAGCSRRGTCNEEVGRCECPLGWTGPTCDEVGATPPGLVLRTTTVLTSLCALQMAAPACKLSPDYIMPCTYVTLSH
jgi:hypothetical protein